MSWWCLQFVAKFWRLLLMWCVHLIFRLKFFCFSFQHCQRNLRIMVVSEIHNVNCFLLASHEHVFLHYFKIWKKKKNAKHSNFPFVVCKLINSWHSSDLRTQRSWMRGISNTTHHYLIEIWIVNKKTYFSSVNWILSEIVSYMIND